MTISPLDTSELFYRANDFMTSAATTTQYVKDMNHSHHNPSDQSTSTSTDNHELELNFLSEFLMHEDFPHDPTNPASSIGLLHHGQSGSFVPEMKLEAMPTEGTPHLGGRQQQQLSLEQFQYQQQVHNAQHGPSSPHSTSSSGADGGEPLDRKAKRRQQVAISARRHRSRKKHELLDLRKEVSFMTSQLDFLRSKHKMMRPNSAVAEWEEKAMAQRHKRRQAESQSEELRRAIFLQSLFLSNLKSVFTNSPMFTEDLNLRQLLHTYTRLGRNPRSRQRDYESLCQQSKLQMASDILRRQTESIRFSTPFIKTQLIDSVDLFGATIVSVYAFNTLDVATVFRATCSAIKESSNCWPEFKDMDGQRTIVDALPKSNIVYGKQTTRYRSESDSTDNNAVNEDEIIVETRVISFWSFTEHEAVLMWDFIDDDDLHPVRDDCDVKRDMVGATLVRRELCEDGKERVVCRSICSKLHKKPTGVSSQSATSKSLLSKFASSPSRSLTRMCGNVVFKSIEKATAGLSL